MFRARILLVIGLIAAQAYAGGAHVVHHVLRGKERVPCRCEMTGSESAGTHETCCELSAQPTDTNHNCAECHLCHTPGKRPAAPPAKRNAGWAPETVSVRCAAPIDLRPGCEIALGETASDTLNPALLHAVVLPLLN